MTRPKGRPRKPGERTPCGALKRQRDDGMTVTVWQRIKADGIRVGTDPRLGSQLGRLGMIGDLTAPQVAAGFRVGGIYREFERHHSRQRSVQSPKYEPSCGRRAAETETDQDRAVAAERAYLALQDELSSYSSGVRNALEGLCVDDLSVPSWSISDVRRILTRLARNWLIHDPIETKGERR